jgi:hypothetical protein
MLSSSNMSFVGDPDVSVSAAETITGIVANAIAKNVCRMVVRFISSWSFREQEQDLKTHLFVATADNLFGYIMAKTTMPPRLAVH